MPQFQSTTGQNWNADLNQDPQFPTYNTSFSGAAKGVFSSSSTLVPFLLVKSDFSLDTYLNTYPAIFPHAYCPVVFPYPFPDPNLFGSIKTRVSLNLVTPNDLLPNTSGKSLRFAMQLRPRLIVQNGQRSDLGIWYVFPSKWPTSWQNIQLGVGDCASAGYRRYGIDLEPLEWNPTPDKPRVGGTGGYNYDINEDLNFYGSATKDDLSKLFINQCCIRLDCVIEYASTLFNNWVFPNSVIYVQVNISHVIEPRQ